MQGRKPKLDKNYLEEKKWLVAEYIRLSREDIDNRYI